MRSIFILAMLGTLLLLPQGSFAEINAECQIQHVPPTKHPGTRTASRVRTLMILRRAPNA